MVNTTNYKTNKKPVKMDYLDDIDISEFREIDVYKRQPSIKVNGVAGAFGLNGATVPLLA